MTILQKQQGHLQLARLDDGWLLGVVDLAGAGAGGLNGADDVHGLVVSDLAEDDVLAVQPAGDDGGDEELGAVAWGILAGNYLREGKDEGVREKGKGNLGLRVIELTCLGRRWPWTEVLGGCACGRSSHRRTSHRRWTCHRCPSMESVDALLGHALIARGRRTLPRVKSPP